MPKNTTKSKPAPKGPKIFKATPADAALALKWGKAKTCREMKDKVCVALPLGHDACNCPECEEGRRCPW